LTSLSKKQKRKIWATIFAIKLFEIQLAGESEVLGMVVDKAWAWISTVVGNEDIKRWRNWRGRYWADDHRSMP